MREAGISEGKMGQELVSLLEDEPFRMVSQLGLLGDSTVHYDAVKTCLVCSGRARARVADESTRG